jgi:hypothetical protein
MRSRPMPFGELGENARTLSSMPSKWWECARGHGHSVARHAQLLSTLARMHH